MVLTHLTQKFWFNSGPSFLSIADLISAFLLSHKSVIDEDRGDDDSPGQH